MDEGICKQVTERISRLSESRNEWEPLACKRQRTPTGRAFTPHLTCPGRVAFRLHLAEEAKEDQRGLGLSGDTQQRLQAGGEVALSTAPNHSYLHLPGSHWAHQVSKALRKTSQGKGNGDPTLRGQFCFLHGMWGEREEGNVCMHIPAIQTKEYYTAIKNEGILWKGMKWRTMFIIYAGRKVLHSYLLKYVENYL